MSIYLSIIEILKIIGIIGSAFVFLMGISKTVREWCILKYKNYKEFQKARREIPQILKNIDERLARVEYEISPNSGTSMKDSLNIIKAEIDANNWLSLRPTFRCTSNGVNTFVNEAYCQLCGVSAGELMKLGWRSFAYDEDQADDYYHRFKESTSNQSQFSGRLKIKSSKDEYRGEWMIRIRPLGPIVTSGGRDFLWSGAFWPYDNEAKQYAKQYNIPLI
jgi:PAS domain-containing protein